MKLIKYIIILFSVIFIENTYSQIDSYESNKRFILNDPIILLSDSISFYLGSDSIDFNYSDYQITLVDPKKTIKYISIVNENDTNDRFLLKTNKREIIENITVWNIENDSIDSVILLYDIFYIPKYIILNFIDPNHKIYLYEIN